LPAPPPSVRRCLAAAPALALALGLGAARAEPVTVEGITFSDELGGFRIVGVSGRGSLDDPFILLEEVTGKEAAILTIRGLTAAFGNRVRTHHAVAFALTKVTINRSGRIWHSYQHELQEILGRDSTYGDGLSFGQAQSSPRPLSSDSFADYSIVDEPLDGLNFAGGDVRDGGRASFSLVISDNTPIDTFFLVQTQPDPIAREEGQAGPEVAEAGPPLQGVSITAGEIQTEAKPGEFRVAKKLLISNLEARMHSKELLVARDLAEAATLEDEMKTFRRTTSEAGRMAFGARSGKHDHLIMSAALALWWLMQPTRVARMVRMAI
jgi:hypothetical protein